MYLNRGVTGDVILCVSLNVPPIRKSDAIPHLVALPFVETPFQRDRLRHVAQERTLIEGNFRIIPKVLYEKPQTAAYEHET